MYASQQRSKNVISLYVFHSHQEVYIGAFIKSKKMFKEISQFIYNRTSIFSHTLIFEFVNNGIFILDKYINLQTFALAKQ